MEILTLRIDDIVPGELVLEKEVVARYRQQIRDGVQLKLPLIKIINSDYFATDGNHKIYALKLEGIETVECKIVKHKFVNNVCDHSVDACQEAISKGHKGFNGIILGTRQDKLDFYESEESYDDVLLNIDTSDLPHLSDSGEIEF